MFHNNPIIIIDGHFLFSQDDEEWDDYRENKKDYSGLKIETLVIEDVGAKQEEEETEVGAATRGGKIGYLTCVVQVNENGEIVKKEESGPWNKKEAERTNSGEMKEDSPVAETTVMPGTGEPMPGVVGGTYVPPGRRGGAGAGDTAQPAPQQRPRR